jgi:hypothetical protein
MQLKVGNEDSCCYKQKYMQITLTAVVIAPTGRISSCLFVLSIKFTTVKIKRTQGSYIFMQRAVYQESIVQSAIGYLWKHSTF